MTLTKLQHIERILQEQRISDILTKNIFARELSVSTDTAEKILIDLVNLNQLDIIIRVACENEDPHYTWFNSLKHYYETPQTMVCQECGAPLLWHEAKVGFKRRNI